MVVPHPVTASPIAATPPFGATVGHRRATHNLSLRILCCICRPSAASVVLECVPAPVAAATTTALQIPKIGIEAGPFCSGQTSRSMLGTKDMANHAIPDIILMNDKGPYAHPLSKAFESYTVTQG